MNRIRVQFQTRGDDVVESGHVEREGILNRSNLSDAASKLRENINAYRDKKLAELALAALRRVLESSVFDYSKTHSGRLHYVEFDYDGDRYRIDVDLFGSYEPQ